MVLKVKSDIWEYFGNDVRPVLHYNIAMCTHNVPYIAPSALRGTFIGNSGEIDGGGVFQNESNTDSRLVH